ncbi:hypothetical protein P8935_00110 [Telmatobacter sp. DSM 110680]|uniref:Curli production assembly/transport component CsgE n=1 Tax=Telmatobacter sp. DSM 110680 TaxID=3036704 RepID=A0AAU7DK99_9BACT
MAFRNQLLVIVGLLVLQPLFLVSQEQRPPLIPMATGSGSSSGANASSPGSVGNLSEGPIAEGEVVHISVFNAPDFSFVTRVSESGDIPYRFLVGAKLRELEQAVKHATSDEEMRAEIARLTRQKLTSPS